MSPARVNRNDYFLVLADQIIFSGSNFVLTFLLARLLSIEDFGLYSYVLLLTYFLLSISNAIIVQPFQILVSKKETKEAMGFSLKLVISFLALTAVFLGILYFVFEKNSFSLKFISVFQQYFFGILVFAIGYLFQDFFRKSLLAIPKIKWVLIIDLIFLLVFLGLIKTDLTLNNALLVIGIFNILSGLPGLFYFLRQSKFRINNQEYIQYHVSQGKWLLSSAILQWVSSNFIVFVSGIYLGLQALGALRLVQSFFGVLNVLLQTVENYFLPKVAQLYFKNKREANRYLVKITNHGFLIFGTILFLFFVFSDSIIVILGGEKYRAFGFVIKLMTILYACIFIGYPVRMRIRIFELNKQFFFGYILSIGFTLVSFHFLLKYASLYGAVAGLVISQLIMMGYWKFQLNKNSSLKWT